MRAKASDEPAPAFWFEVETTADHIDVQGHVNNKVYVAWAEEAGVRHWTTVAPPEARAQWVWVASRFEVDFLAETKLGERIRIETWLGEPKGARFDRHVRIVGADGKARARAVTTWALLDRATRRPKRVPPDLVALFSAAPD